MVVGGGCVWGGEASERCVRMVKEGGGYAVVLWSEEEERWFTVGD